MDGYKTLLGGIGMILTGVGIIAAAVNTGDYSHMGEAFAMIALGLTTIGIGSKIQKNTEASKEITDAVHSNTAAVKQDTASVIDATIKHGKIK